MIDSTKTEPSELDKRFWAFHKENPQVFEKLEELTLQAYSHGRKKIGIKMIFEVLRWNSMMSTSGDTYKLNNSYFSRYVRILIDKHPEYRDLFEMRKIKS